MIAGFAGNLAGSAGKAADSAGQTADSAGAAGQSAGVADGPAGIARHSAGQTQAFAGRIPNSAGTVVWNAGELQNFAGATGHAAGKLRLPSDLRPSSCFPNCPSWVPQHDYANAPSFVNSIRAILATIPEGRFDNELRRSRADAALCFPAAMAFFIVPARMKRRSARWLLWLALPGCLFGFAQGGLAHTTGLSTSELKFGTNGLDAEITFAGADLALALAHLDAANPADWNRDGKLTSEEFAAGVQRVRKFAASCLAVEFDGRAAPPGPARLGLDDKDNFRVEVSYAGERPGRLKVSALLFEHLPPEHIHFITLHGDDSKSLGNKMLSPGDNTFEINLSATRAAEAEKEQPPVSPFAGFLKLGIEHICTGYDHLLFLFGLLLVCANFKSAIQVVTFFTLAHSITLALATLNLVRISGRLVEAAVAASIIYVAVENLVQAGAPKGRWRVTFLFGLIHGIGFATVLRDLGVAASTTGVAVPLVAFNVGVELGQIVIVGLILPVIWTLRKRDLFLRWGVPACSGLVALLGGIWLTKRLFF